MIPGQAYPEGLDLILASRPDLAFLRPEWVRAIHISRHSNPLGEIIYLAVGVSKCLAADHQALWQSPVYWAWLLRTTCRLGMIPDAEIIAQVAPPLTTLVCGQSS